MVYMGSPERTQYTIFHKKPIWLMLCLSIVAGPLCNAAINLLAGILRLPLFLDSIATCVIAALFGPLAGIITGFSTNWFIELLNGFPMTNYPFALVGMTTGLIVGLFVKKDRFSTIQSFFIVLLIVTISNALLGSIIATFVFGGITQTNLDYLVTGLAIAGRSIFSAAFLARIPANLIDKGIALGIAFLLYNRLYMQRRVFSFRNDQRDNADTPTSKTD